MKAVSVLAASLTVGWMVSLVATSCNLLVGDGNYVFERGVDSGVGVGAAVDTGHAPSDAGGSPAAGGISGAPSGSGGGGNAGAPGGSLGGRSGSAGETTGGTSGAAGQTTGASGGSAGATTGGMGGSAGATTGASLVQVYYEGTGSPETTEELEFAFALRNPGTAALDLSTVTVRYYFSADGCALADLVERCDFSLLNLAATACPSATFVTLPNPKPTADSYVELRLTGAGVLAPTTSPSYQTTGAFHHAAYACTFRQSNDYSYASNLPAFTLTHTMTAYINGALVWGAAP